MNQKNEYEFVDVGELSTGIKINEGKYEVSILKDGWTAVTKDKKPSAQFEHTIGITENGNEIFTLSQNNSDFPINPI